MVGNKFSASSYPHTIIERKKRARPRIVLQRKDSARCGTVRRADFGQGIARFLFEGREWNFGNANAERVSVF